MLQLVEDAALSVGLGLNAKKTKAMIFNIPPTSIDDFKYL